MTPTSRYLYAASFILVAAGFLGPWWPLSVLGLALAALSGRWIFGIFIGLLLDLAYGAPTATANFLIFPFGLFAVFLALVRYVGSTYFFNRSTQEKI